MAINIYIDGEFFKQYDSPQEVNKEQEANKEIFGRVAIQKSEAREDGDYDLFMITIPE